MMSEQLPAKVPEQKPDKVSGDEEPKKEGRLGWIVGWVLLPGSVLGGLFGFGVWLGANHSDSWFTQSVMWVVDLF